MEQQVILVNYQDEVIGSMEKMEAHRNAILHRAFSIFIFDRKGRMLLQQRALNKYHSGGLWTNACCSHPQPGEDTITAAARRLHEEMGFDVPLEPMFQFTYKAGFENGLTEHEFDHVYFGNYDGGIFPNPAEVMDYAYKSVSEVTIELRQHPGRFTAWFRIAFPMVEKWLQVNKINL